MIGSNAWPQYNFRRLVNLSIKEGSPIIGINIKYDPLQFVLSAIFNLFALTATDWVHLDSSTVRN